MKSKHDWSKVNWKTNDATIARELGVSREAVRQQRKNRGKAQSPDWHQARGTKAKLQKLKTRGMTSAEIATELGLKSADYAKQLCAKHGKTFKHGPGNRKYDWASVNWKRPVRDIAADLGITCLTIVYARKSLEAKRALAKAALARAKSKADKLAKKAAKAARDRKYRANKKLKVSAPVAAPVATPAPAAVETAASAPEVTPAAVPTAATSAAPETADTPKV